MITRKQELYLDHYQTSGSFSATALHFGKNESSVRRAIRRAEKTLAMHGEIPELGLSQYSSSSVVTGVSQYITEGDFKGWVKRKIKDEPVLSVDIDEMVKSFMEGFPESIQPAPFHGSIKTNLLTSYCLGDAHFGMLAYEPETGEDYDTDIAEADTKTAIKYLIEQSPPSQVGVLCNVGDIFHSDTDDNRTSSGNPLDTDTRQSKVRGSVIRAIRYAIDSMLEKHDSVWIVSQKGNHDEISAGWLNKIIEVAYEKEPRVKVFPNDRRLTFYHWGENFIAVQHGDKNKNEQRTLNHLVSDYRKELRENNYVLFGHIHHKTFKELGGVQFESMCTLASKDYYHDASCYGARREMKSIVFHKSHGKVMEYHCPISMVKALQEV